MTKNQEPAPIRGDSGGTVLGPTNPEREQQNPDIVAPPSTDYGTFPNLRWSFADSHMRLEEGGWSREVTIREMPSSPTLAGVNMRLTAGGVREMHWHREAEWSYVIKGNLRITVVDTEGRTFQDDLTEGDLWYFPPGIPHSIQGLGPDGCEFILVFDDGNFTENSTFQLTDWIAHTPKEILAKNFAAPVSAFSQMPKKELYIFQAELPLQPLQIQGKGPTLLKYSHRLLQQKPYQMAHGKVRIVDSSIFPISQSIAAALVEIEPGGMRELHWHTNNDEWQYFLSGTARMTVFAGEGRARTFNFQAGDVGSVPFPMAHYIENTGKETLRFLEVFKSNYFADVSLAEWLAFTPHELVHAHLKIDESILKKVSPHKNPIV